MFELPELRTLAVQVNETLDGKVVGKGSLGNAPHKFVWYNRSPGEFEALTRGKKIGKAWVRGKWLFIPREPGYVLLLGECGARVLFHPPGAAVPKKFHLHLAAGNPEKHVVGGHLFQATVSTLNEICLARFDSIRLNRAFNPRSGLRELVLE